MKDLWLSKDFARLEEYNALITKECKFLDMKESIAKVAFASFPRTGNSFLRKIFE